MKASERFYSELFKKEVEMILSGIAGSKSRSIIRFLVASFALIMAFSVLSFSVSAGLDVDISFRRDTFEVGDDADLQLYFSRSVTYTIKQVDPNYRTIIRNRHAGRGHHSIDGSIDAPTGRKTLKVIAEDNYGNRATDTFTYRVVSGGQDYNNSGDGGSENYSLSYFKSRRPSQAEGAANSLRSQIEVIRPGESNYNRIKRSFQSRAGSIELSRERQGTQSMNFNFSFGGSDGMEFSLGQGNQNYYSLNRSLQNQGATFFGSSGNQNYLVGGGVFRWGPDDGDDHGGGGHHGSGHCICRLPCSCFTCCQPTFICLPRWVPWPLPTPWLYWIIMMM